MSVLEIKINEKTAKGKYILQLLKENNVKIKYPTKMTEKEFDAKIQKAREQYARGEYTEVPFGQQSKFLQEL